MLGKWGFFFFFFFRGSSDKLARLLLLNIDTFFFGYPSKNENKRVKDGVSPREGLCTRACVRADRDIVGNAREREKGDREQGGIRVKNIFVKWKILGGREEKWRTFLVNVLFKCEAQWRFFFFSWCGCKRRYLFFFSFVSSTNYPYRLISKKKKKDSLLGLLFIVLLRYTAYHGIRYLQVK